MGRREMIFNLGAEFWFLEARKVLIFFLFDLFNLVSEDEK